MNVFVDFDGVLADTSIVKREWVEAATGRHINGSIDRSTLLPLIGEDAYFAMQAGTGYEDTLRALPMSGAVRVLGRLSQEARIVVVSARPPEKMVWLNRWLDCQHLRGIVAETASSFASTKGEIVRQRGEGWLIDDDVRHAAELPNDSRFILFGFERRGGHGGAFACDWSSVEAIMSASKGVREH